MLADPESAKKTAILTVFFGLWGSVLLKADQRMLMKLTPVVDFINIMQPDFTRTDPKCTKKIDNSTVFFAILGRGV